MATQNERNARRPKKIGVMSGHHRPNNGQFKPGNPGRPPGIKSKKLVGAKQMAAEILLSDDPAAYKKNIRRRILAGHAPHMELFLAQHLWGKPQDHISVTLTEVHLLAVVKLDDMHLQAFLAALREQRVAEALALLPGEVA